MTAPLAAKLHRGLCSRSCMDFDRCTELNSFLGTYCLYSNMKTQAAGVSNYNYLIITNQDTD